MSTYPLICPRCKRVQIVDAKTNCGTDDAPFCVVCYFKQMGEPSEGMTHASSVLERETADRLLPGRESDG